MVEIICTGGRSLYSRTIHISIAFLLLVRDVIFLLPNLLCVEMYRRPLCGASRDPERWSEKDMRSKKIKGERKMVVKKDGLYFVLFFFWVGSCSSCSLLSKIENLFIYYLYVSGESCEKQRYRRDGKRARDFFFYLLRVRELPCGSCPIIIPNIFSERCYITSISIGSALTYVSLGLSFQPSSSFLLGLSHVDFFVYRSTAALFIKGSSLPVIYKDAWCESGLILHAGPHRPRSMGSLLE